MSQQSYAVYAFSPTLNQKVRQLDLATINEAQKSYDKAMAAAYIFAHLQNKAGYMQATDWQPLVQDELHGIDTLPGFLFHDITR